MATLVIIKNSKVTGDIPPQLSPGELAINIVDGKLYYGDVNNAAQLLISSTGVVDKIIAGTNVAISPTGGTGNVTINASGGGGSSGIVRGILPAFLVPDNLYILIGKGGIGAKISGGGGGSATGGFGGNGGDGLGLIISF